jgi:hypothetical protein
MDEVVVASRKGIRYPCLHDEWDSPLGPCTTIAGAELVMWRRILVRKRRPSDPRDDESQCFSRVGRGRTEAE